MIGGTESRIGRLVLMAAHCAGMVDLVALPVWVGTLIAHYQFDPQQAGALATLFLTGAVAASLYCAPRFNRMRGRLVAPLGFGAAALSFFALAATADYATMAVLHVAGGVAVGCALSFTHGTIGRSANPHRLFALVGVALGVFAVVFLGATPRLVAATGGPTLFKAFGTIMAVAALLAALAFPVPVRGHETRHASLPKLNLAVWFGVLGVTAMAVVQAMTFSFIERIGVDRGFGADAVHGVLLALGIVNLFPALLAGLLERHVAARRVVLAGPVLQAVIALFIAQSASFAPYAVATSVFAFVMIFTHTFAFGLLARMDPSGRAVAATPAMLMIGSAIGPILGGTLVKASGYGSLGIAAVLIAAVAIGCFAQLQRKPATGIA
ncbi:MAG TPA: MFS transporter [Burkholderiaceae bacterium]|nr:MFS transporter [Burkholderiaceae bacterium]